MKKTVLAIIIGLSLSGCASQKAYDQYNNQFAAMATQYYKAASDPLVDIKLPAPNGQNYAIKVYREIKALTPQQIKDSEWVPVITAGVSGGLSLGAKWFDYKALVSNNDAQTEQLKNYVEQFNKESYTTETSFIESVSPY